MIDSQGSRPDIEKLRQAALLDLANKKNSPPPDLISQLARALSDLNRLGLSFEEIETQSHVSLDFLVEAYNRCKLTIPPRIKMRHLQARQQKLLQSIPKNTLSIPSKTPSIEPRGQKRKFGHDRWSNRLDIDLSEDEEDSENETKKNENKKPHVIDAKKELLEKRREIEKIKKLLFEAESARAMSNKAQAQAHDRSSSPFVEAKTVPNDENINENSKEIPLGPSPYDDMIATLNDNIESMYGELQRLEKVSGDLTAKLKSINTSELEMEIKSLETILEEKRNKAREATIESTRISAQLDVTQEAFVKINSSLQKFQQQHHTLQKKRSSLILNEARESSASPMVVSPKVNASEIKDKEMNMEVEESNVADRYIDKIPVELLKSDVQSQSIPISETAKIFDPTSEIVNPIDTTEQRSKVNIAETGSRAATPQARSVDPSTSKNDNDLYIKTDKTDKTEELLQQTKKSINKKAHRPSSIELIEKTGGNEIIMSDNMESNEMTKSKDKIEMSPNKKTKSSDKASVMTKDTQLESSANVKDNQLKSPSSDKGKQLVSSSVKGKQLVTSRAKDIQSISSDIEPNSPISPSISQPSSIFHGFWQVDYDKPETFKPFESPLKTFDSYRLSPMVNGEEDKSLLRSLTYNSSFMKKNPSKVYCMIESSGKECKDPKCKYLHSRDFEIDDTQLILGFAETRRFSSKQNGQSFRKQLRQQIQEKQSFDNIARSIIGYGQEKDHQFLDWVSFDVIIKHEKKNETVS